MKLKCLALFAFLIGLGSCSGNPTAPPSKLIYGGVVFVRVTDSAKSHQEADEITLSIDSYSDSIIGEYFSVHGTPETNAQRVFHGAVKTDTGDYITLYDISTWPDDLSYQQAVAVDSIGNGSIQLAKDYKNVLMVDSFDHKLYETFLKN